MPLANYLQAIAPNPVLSEPVKVATVYAKNVTFSSGKSTIINVAKLLKEQYGSLIPANSFNGTIDLVIQPAVTTGFDLGSAPANVYLQFDDGFLFLYPPQRGQCNNVKLNISFDYVSIAGKSTNAFPASRLFKLAFYGASYVQPYPLPNDASKLIIPATSDAANLYDQFAGATIDLTFHHNTGIRASNLGPCEVLDRFLVAASLVNCWVADGISTPEFTFYNMPPYRDVVSTFEPAQLRATWTEYGHGLGE